ncbi:MAG: hypothetical protein ACO3YX_08025 [Candidatus Nanopelagicaceae bacterium]
MARRCSDCVYFQYDYTPGDRKTPPDESVDCDYDWPVIEEATMSPEWEYLAAHYCQRFESFEMWEKRNETANSLKS